MYPNSAKTVFMFKHLGNTNPEQHLSFTFDGRSVSAIWGMSVAAALLGHDILAFRDTPVSGKARGPFCLMGTCYDCLVVIDGETVQACMTPASEGLIVTRVPTDNVDTL